jgi:hypothetical protein
MRNLKEGCGKEEETEDSLSTNLYKMEVMLWEDLKLVNMHIYMENSAAHRYVYVHVSNHISEIIFHLLNHSELAARLVTIHIISWSKWEGKIIHSIICDYIINLISYSW